MCYPPGLSKSAIFWLFIILFKQPRIEPKRKRGRPRIVKNVRSYSAAMKDVDVNHVLQNNPNGVNKEVFI